MSATKRKLRDKALGRSRSIRRTERRCWWTWPLGHVWPTEWQGEYPYRFQVCLSCRRSREESVEY